jgi:hypothetical protein
LGWYEKCIGTGVEEKMIVKIMTRKIISMLIGLSMFLIMMGMQMI